MGAVFESEPNDSLGAAQNVDSFFNLSFNPNIENAAGINTSTTIPHVEIISPGDSSVTTDFYSFTVGGPTTVTIDIDCGNTAPGFPPSCPVGSVDIDSWIEVYDPFAALFTFNDDSSTDTGSSSTLDSFLEIGLPSAGTWTVRVGEYPGISPIASGGDYVLYISVPEPSAILQLVAGGIGLAFLNKRRLRKNVRAESTS